MCVLNVVYGRQGMYGMCGVYGMCGMYGRYGMCGMYGMRCTYGYYVWYIWCVWQVNIPSMVCMVCAACVVWYVGQRLVACGSICEHLEAFGSIWGVLWLMQQDPICMVCMYVWYVWYGMVCIKALKHTLNDLERPSPTPTYSVIIL